MLTVSKYLDILKPTNRIEVFQMVMINKSLIDLEASEDSQKAIFKHLAQMAFDEGRIADIDGVENGLKDREMEATTGFGKGIAIPHTKSKYVKEPTIIVLRNNQEIEWNSLDGKPVNMFINLLVPDGKSNIHLKMLAKLSRQLMHKEFTTILKEGSEGQILEAIQNVLNS
ncbi:PTS fructose transporter subunit IIA [Pediococcus pentosaceus]|jgi:fructose-specific PTS system IIA-like component|uniref:PTS fructose transporter subunit IIA n=2 Tax=Pediococcus pentosaceus TaxID=1255 RepID=UPI0009C19874|nr:PTS fructose transporter subunit IIA [Pediococcus pentosaceus]MBF7120299.1 PTS fructose transporter subunit IIA [Pediococcus pentosaceus]MBU7003640.1 PTS fructose transporter subunit IIA [Pediococcus pentosaceus]MCG7196896.1 PTS fructose transporter subunit IIA [Pediococcus pentosaceus]MCG9225755.1 PTS fructose transporter subunit IIA [Pediococcus pentosaceus]MCI2396705.1 PTS fructose transporter subunit IIA [Pediococcus pentosaceus]